MTDTLAWRVRGESFQDGSKLQDWRKIYESGEWHWQYDTHKLSFEIYKFDGQYWKLYRARFVPDGGRDYAYDFGGQACRMALVRYRHRAKSPHSSRLMEQGSEEWVRTYEVDKTIHEVVQAGATTRNMVRPTAGSGRLHNGDTSRNGRVGVSDHRRRRFHRRRPGPPVKRRRLPGGDDRP